MYLNSDFQFFAVVYIWCYFLFLHLNFINLSVSVKFEEFKYLEKPTIWYKPQFSDLIKQVVALGRSLYIPYLGILKLAGLNR